MITIPRRILSSPLLQAGYANLGAWMPARSVAAVLHEARAQLQHAQAVSVSRCDDDSQRGGSPARCYLSAAGGAALSALYGDRELQRLIAAVAGFEVAPTSVECGGSFTYYCRKGDFLAIHRDIVACDVAVITCLEDSGVQGSGGKLCLYPTRIWEPLAAIRRDPMRGAQPVRLAPGDTAVLLGGVVPHCTLPVAQGQSRVVALLCYRALES